eukprot:11204992-Lingulodinium_polyedra.AAC.1
MGRPQQPPARRPGWQHATLGLRPASTNPAEGRGTTRMALPTWPKHPKRMGRLHSCQTWTPSPGCN